MYPVYFVNDASVRTAEFPHRRSRLAVRKSACRQIEERSAVVRHGGDQEIAIEKQVAHLAARFGNEQAAVAGGAVGCAIAAAVVGLVVGADRIVGADGGALQCAR